MYSTTSTYITFDPTIIISNSRSFDTSYRILRVHNFESKSRENIRAKRIIKVSEMFEFVLIFGGLKVYDNFAKSRSEIYFMDVSVFHIITTKEANCKFRMLLI